MKEKVNCCVKEKVMCCVRKTKRTENTFYIKCLFNLCSIILSHSSGLIDLLFLRTQLAAVA